MRLRMLMRTLLPTVILSSLFMVGCMPSPQDGGTEPTQAQVLLKLATSSSSSGLKPDSLSALVHDGQGKEFAKSALRLQDTTTAIPLAFTAPVGATAYIRVDFFLGGIQVAVLLDTLAIVENAAPAPRPAVVDTARIAKAKADQGAQKPFFTTAPTSQQTEEGKNFQLDFQLANPSSTLPPLIYRWELLVSGLSGEGARVTIPAANLPTVDDTLILIAGTAFGIADTVKVLMRAPDPSLWDEAANRAAAGAEFRTGEAIDFTLKLRSTFADARVRWVLRQGQDSLAGGDSFRIRYAYESPVAADIFLTAIALHAATGKSDTGVYKVSVKRPVIGQDAILDDAVRFSANRAYAGKAFAAAIRLHPHVSEPVTAYKWEILFGGTSRTGTTSEIDWNVPADLKNTTAEIRVQVTLRNGAEDSLRWQLEIQEFREVQKDTLFSLDLSPEGDTLRLRVYYYHATRKTLDSVRVFDWKKSRSLPYSRARYTYDNLSRLVEETVHVGEALHLRRRYQFAGGLLAAIETLDSAGVEYVDSLQYDAQGHPVESRRYADAALRSRTVSVYMDGRLQSDTLFEMREGKASAAQAIRYAYGAHGISRRTVAQWDPAQTKWRDRRFTDLVYTGVGKLKEMRQYEAGNVPFLETNTVFAYAELGLLTHYVVYQYSGEDPEELARSLYGYEPVADLFKRSTGYAPERAFLPRWMPWMK